MATNELNNKIFQDETKAREWLEGHLWREGRVCGYCGTVDNSTPIAGREGYYQCNAKGCRKQFTVRVGTVFERSHISLNKWLMAAFLLCASKKGISAHQMHRMIGVSYKSTWFMMHRLREAMKDGTFSPMGGEGQVIEADETFIGTSRKKRYKERSWDYKQKVAALVERGGRARSVHIPDLSRKTIREVPVRNADRKSHLVTDEAVWYKGVGKEFYSHLTVNHSADEYVRGDIHTNTIEGYFSIFKRGMKGIYQHCGEQHLQRYLAEFDFRYSNRSALGVNDRERTEKLLAGAIGKRLTYRRIDIGANV